MKELSLFSGAGGGLLGTYLLGWEPIGYVECDDYCQRVISQRIKDGIFPEAPIFGDIKAFISDGYAKRYRGMADVITAGFPCQPFSVAGKREGADDERNLWPQTIECIRIVRPRYALLENVPGLLASGYCGTIFGDLAEAGYDARWCVLGADDCGGVQRRERLWILAHTECGGLQGKWSKHRKQDSEWVFQLERLHEKERGLAVPTGKGGGVSDGVAHRIQRLKALGNGQVPIVVKTVWEVLNV